MTKDAGTVGPTAPAAAASVPQTVHEGGALRIAGFEGTPDEIERQLVAGRGPNNTNVARHLVIERSDIATVLNDVLAHFEGDGPDPAAIPGPEGFPVGG